MSSGGGGNRKLRISSRFTQLRGITGNQILSQRKRKTRKSTFGKTLCQLAKPNARLRREGRTWETCPPPRPWVRWPARCCRARGMRNRVSWRAPSYSSWHVGAAPSDDPIKRWSLTEPRADRENGTDEVPCGHFTNSAFGAVHVLQIAQRSARTLVSVSFGPWR